MSRTNTKHTRTHINATFHIFSTHRTHVTFPVNVLSGRRQWRRCGGGFGGGSEGIAVTRRQRGMVVTRTGHYHPRGYRRHDPPMQNHPLSRSMGNYFLSVDYGVNFRTTRPDYFKRDTTPVRGIAEEGSRSNVAAIRYPSNEPIRLSNN